MTNACEQIRKEHNMATLGFGDHSPELGYRVLDERVMRASAGIMLLLGLIAFINAFIFRNYIVIPFVAGFLAMNFIIGLFVGSSFAPTILLGKLATLGQSPLPIGAVQKKFAWSLGLTLAAGIFILSFFLLGNEAFFAPVCLMCLLCLSLLFLETAFGICLGCKLYGLSLRLKLIAPPEVSPNCIGDSCKVN